MKWNPFSKKNNSRDSLLPNEEAKIPIGPSRVIINKKNNMKIERASSTGKCIDIDDKILISETDPEGFITFTNKVFREVTGFSKEELVGSPHFINRHPDMPKEAFFYMWKTIKAGKMWRGHMKNICKNGDHYWVLVYIQPKYDGEKLIGYIATRKHTYRDDIERLEEVLKIVNHDSLKGKDFFDTDYADYVAIMKK